MRAETRWQRLPCIAALVGALHLAGAFIAPVAAQDDDELARAVELFEQSEEHYNAGDFTEAAELLREAYALTPDPTLLFNLARAQEGMGDLDGAVESYTHYLEEAGDVPDRGAVERRIETLGDQRDLLAEADANERGGVVESEQESEPRVSAPTEPELDDEATRAPIAPWLIAGGGVLVMAGGLVFGAMSATREDDANREPTMVQAVALHDEAKTFATVANVLYIGGGAAFLAGLIWGIVSLTRGSSESSDAAARAARSPAVYPTLYPGGIGVSGSF